MEIQNYNQRYEQAVVDLWNACLPCDPLTLQKFRKQALLDDNFDPSLCYVALDDQEVAGFLLATAASFLIWNGERNRTGAGSTSCSLKLDIAARESAGP